MDLLVNGQETEEFCKESRCEAYSIAGTDGWCDADAFLEAWSRLESDTLQEEKEKVSEEVLAEELHDLFNRHYADDRSMTLTKYVRFLELLISKTRFVKRGQEIEQEASRVRLYEGTTACGTATCWHMRVVKPSYEIPDGISDPDNLIQHYPECILHTIWSASCAMRRLLKLGTVPTDYETAA